MRSSPAISSRFLAQSNWCAIRSTTKVRCALSLVHYFKLDCAVLERDLKSPKLQKASQLYALLSKTPGEQVLYLAVYSTQRIVHDRIRNYFQKYLPAALEVTNEVVAATGVAPGTPKFHRIKDEMIVTRLDARPKKVAPAPRAASATAAHVGFCARIGDAPGAFVTRPPHNPETRPRRSRASYRGWKDIHGAANRLFEIRPWRIGGHARR